MSFVTQDDVFAAIEPVLHGVFEEFADGKRGDPGRRRSRASPMREAMLNYGTDKPDLRNPLRDRRRRRGLRRLRLQGRSPSIVAAGGVVRAIPAPEAAGRAAKFFDKLNAWAQGEGMPGLGYIVARRRRRARARSPSSWPTSGWPSSQALTGAEDGDAVFFVADKPDGGGEARRPGAHPRRPRSST